MGIAKIGAGAVISLIALRIISQHSHDVEQALQVTQAQAQSAPTPTWVMNNKRDPMTDVTTFEATTSQEADGGGSFDITGQCDDGDISFVIDYFAEDDRKDVHYIMTNRGDIRYDLRLDNAESKSHLSGTKYNNEATVMFLAKKSNDRPSTSAAAAAGKLLRTLATAFYSAGTPDQLLSARILRVRLPLTDGREPIVTLDLQDASLHQFFARCGLLGRPAPAVPPQTNASGTAQRRSATVTSVQLNLRAGPSTDYDVVATMDQGSRVTITRQTETEWVEIEVLAKDGSTLHGYANSRFLAAE